MTEQTDIDRPESERSGRGRHSYQFPAQSFEEALALPTAILQHGAGDQMRRLTLFDRLNRSPESGPSRQLVSTSGRYGLTTGGSGAEYLALTSSAKIVLEESRPEGERRQNAFGLAIEQFDPFEKIYDRLKNKRLPASDVLIDEVGQVGVPEADRPRAAAVFISNARYLGLIREISGSERLLPIEQVVEELSDVPVTLGTEAFVPQERTPSRAHAADTLAEPSVHIDIQIHIDSSASPEQIDQIFASMARHLYRREGQ